MDERISAHAQLGLLLRLLHQQWVQAIHAALDDAGFGDVRPSRLLGRGVQLKKATVRGSVIGDNQVIEGKEVKDSVMDAGELAAAR